MISASIVTLNEGEKLNNCLESIKDFAQEIVVVDLGSRDESLEIAYKHEAKVYQHKFISFVEMVRNFAMSKTKGDWILVLDPDEVMPDKLKNSLRQIVKKNKVDAVNIPRKNIFFGRWIAHTNWWPDRHIRFFKKGKVKWSDKIHSYPKVDGKVLNLQANGDLAIIHHGYDSISQFIDRQNRYSEIEAEQRYKEGERFSWLNFFWWPIREFLVRFIKHSGYLDGFYGFTLSFLMMVYKMTVSVKLWEKEQQFK